MVVRSVDHALHICSRKLPSLNKGVEHRHTAHQLCAMLTHRMAFDCTLRRAHRCVPSRPADEISSGLPPLGHGLGQRHKAETQRCDGAAHSC